MATTIKCLECNTIIVSKYDRHDFKSCVCGKCFVDGGESYSRFGGDHFLLLNYETKEWEEFNLTGKVSKSKEGEII